MITRIWNTILKGGAKIGMVKKYKSITEHPKIAVDPKELARINRNIRMYKGEYAPVTYTTSDNKTSTRPFHSLNIPKIIARKLAKLVFNEGVNIGINDDEEADEFLQSVFEASKFKKNFGEELEAAYAIGGLVLRPYLDERTKEVKISYARAGSFFPVSSTSNDISEMAFKTITTTTENKKVVYYSLLEFHLWNGSDYIIENELYRSEKADELGIQVPLRTLKKYEDMAKRSILKGFTRPLFVHIKLAGKNNANLHSPLSLGIADNSRDQIIDINEKYDQFMFEIKESQRKIMASEHFLRAGYNQVGRPRYTFGDGASVFKLLKGDEPILEEFAPSLRSSEYIETINFILRIIEMQSGFSTGTFSFDGKSVKTATEIVSENSETYATRADNVLIIGEAIKELIINIFELAAAAGIYKKPKNIDVRVDFDDGVFQSQSDKLEFYGKANALGLLSKQKILMSIWGYSEDEADKMLAQIQKEEFGLDPEIMAQASENLLLGDEE